MYILPYTPFKHFDYFLVYSGAIAIYIFPYGTGDIHLDDLHCTGSESRLIDCPHSGAGVHNCSHSEDAGVLCVRPRTLIRNITMINML